MLCSSGFVPGVTIGKRVPLHKVVKTLSLECNIVLQIWCTKHIRLQYKWQLRNHAYFRLVYKLGDKNEHLDLLSYSNDMVWMRCCDGGRTTDGCGISPRLSSCPLHIQWTHCSHALLMPLCPTTPVGTIIPAATRWLVVSTSTDLVYWDCYWTLLHHVTRPVLFCMIFTPHGHWPTHQVTHTDDLWRSYRLNIIGTWYCPLEENNAGITSPWINTKLFPTL